MKAAKTAQKKRGSDGFHALGNFTGVVDNQFKVRIASKHKKTRIPRNSRRPKHRPRLEESRQPILYCARSHNNMAKLRPIADPRVPKRGHLRRIARLISSVSRGASGLGKSGEPRGEETRACTHASRCPNSVSLSPLLSLSSPSLFSSSLLRHIVRVL